MHCPWIGRRRIQFGLGTLLCLVFGAGVFVGLNVILRESALVIGYQTVYQTIAEERGWPFTFSRTVYLQPPSLEYRVLFTPRKDADYIPEIPMPFFRLDLLLCNGGIAIISLLGWAILCEWMFAHGLWMTPRPSTPSCGGQANQ